MRERAPVTVQGPGRPGNGPSMRCSRARPPLRSMPPPARWAGYGCAMLDVGGLVAAHAPDGVTASGMFWDDLHPTPSGHRIIGEALAPLLVQAHERRP